MASSILELMWQRRYRAEKKIVFIQNESTLNEWTYGQMLSYAHRFASAIKNLPSRSLVAISLPTGPEFLASFFGCQLAGHIPAPYPSPIAIRMQSRRGVDPLFFEKSKIKYLVTSEASLFNSVPGVEIIDFTAPEDEDVDLDSVDLSNLAEEFAVQFSSGSTSEPKGVVITHSALMTNLKQMCTALKVTPKDRMSSWLPLYHDMGLVGGVMAPIFSDVTVYLSSPVDFVRDPISWLNDVAERRTSIIVGPDFMYKSLSKRQRQSPDFSGDLSSLRVCMSGSEPVLFETCQNFSSDFSKFGFNSNALLPVYGMAEAVLGVTFPQIGTPVKISRRGHVSCGVPLEGITVSLRNEEGLVCSPEEEGEIFIRGPNISGRFISSESPLAKDGYLATGDLGYLEDGQLYISGRKKDVLILRGQKFHNLDLERNLQSQLGPECGRVAVVVSRETLVVAIETDLWWQKSHYSRPVEAFVKSIDSSLKWDCVLVPKGYLSRTTSGKLRRHQISEDYESGRLASSELQKLYFLLLNQLKKFVFVLKDVSVKNESQKAVPDPLFQKIFKVLKENQVKVAVYPETKITELGLDSVQIVELVNRIEKDFGKIELIDFLDLKTVDDLHRYLSSRL